MDGEIIQVGRVAVGAACAIFDDRGSVLFVRHTYGRLNWELPGGASPPGEAPDETARRDLFEETAGNRRWIASLASISRPTRRPLAA